jgi:hypothetical protein
MAQHVHVARGGARTREQPPAQNVRQRHQRAEKEELAEAAQAGKREVRMFRFFRKSNARTIQDAG